MKNIDYYFTPVSPFTYLGHDRFVAMAKKHGASITVKPVDFGKVFSVSGGLPLKQRAPQRQAYRMFELKRWRELLDARLNLQPKFFPVSGDLASKWILAALERSSGDGVKLAGAIMRAVWAEERDVSDAATLSAIATEQGLDAPALAARAATEDVGARYQALTQEAIDRQVFGAPTYIYRDEPFWGQDRLDFLERALAK
ncbi:MAG: 2-hydroxychromene-2-carboxylate isomerase [Betaproteobacteria bacterium]|nr:MAG: 2-hydroxychromene-2-carboxylate isomerase [Betaproteobacteria bacterium]